MIREWNEESLNHRNALLYVMGVSEEDVKRPVIELVNSWDEVNPGHFPFKDIVAEMKEEVYKAGGLALELPVTGICDGICSNTSGDRYTSPAYGPASSEVKIVAELNMLEGMVIMSTCDKVVPGMIMGALRVNILTMMLTGSSVAAGHTEEGKMLALTHTKQAYAVYVAGDIDRDHYKMVVHDACPIPGAYPFMGTVDTMRALAEILGLSLHGNASVRSQASEWHEMAHSAAHRLVQIACDNIRPQSFTTQESFESAVRYMMAAGGSTNSLLYIPAIAHQIGCETSLKTLDRISREVPAVSTIYPNHPTYTTEEFSAAGGLGAVVKELVKAGKINTKCGGMSGTIGEKAELAYNSNMDVIRLVGEPIHEQGGFAVLHGNIDSESVIVKFSVVDPEARKFSSPTKCYDSQDDAWDVTPRDEIVPGDVVAIRHEGPKGSPGMPHMEIFMAAVLGRGMGKEIAFVSDGHFSGAAGGLAIGHASPEVYEGGNPALIENGDVIHIDIEGRTLTIDVSDEEFDRRHASWRPVEKPTIGWLDLCRRNCIFAHKGATVYWKK